MKGSLLLISISCQLIHLKSISAASPSFLAGRDCESFLCADVPGAIQDTWNVLGIGAGWVLNTLTGLLEPAPPPQPQPAPAVIQPDPNPPNPTVEPDVDPFLPAPPPAQHDCDSDAFAQPDSGGNPAFTNLRPCETPKGQWIIWPVSCDSREQNAAVEQLLSEMDSGFLTSTDPLCAMEGGVSFWLAELSQEQVDTVNQQTTAVKGVEPETPYEIGQLKVTPSEAARTKIPAMEKRYSLEKRIPHTVIKQMDADISLSFLSTPKNKLNSGTYAYFGQAGFGIRLYLVDTGLNALDDEFIRIVPEWIYALRAMPEPFDISQEGSGTCIASKIAGARFGVAKRVRMVAVKMMPTIGSFLNALEKIITDLKLRSVNGFVNGGRTVVSIRGGWPLPLSGGDRTAQRMENLIKRLLQDFQVVVVSASGQDYRNDYPDISLWPAALASKYDIITAGSVQARGGSRNGESFPWSHGGEFLTVNAPGNGACANSNGEIVNAEGDGFSSAVTSGLVAYFLSLPDLGDILRISKNVPAAVKDYLQSMSYRRYMAEKSIWNGLDGEDPLTDYQYWIGTPTQE